MKMFAGTRSTVVAMKSIQDTALYNILPNCTLRPVHFWILPHVTPKEDVRTFPWTTGHEGRPTREKKHATSQGRIGLT